MREGWFGDDYIVLFEDRAPTLQKAYGIASALPEYRLLGLRSWDDFIVERAGGDRFIVPTVPLVESHLSSFTIADHQELEPDESMRGRIKWYVRPLIFGGDPNLGANVTWVTIEEHAELVTWWNAKYREVAAR